MLDTRHGVPVIGWLLTKIIGTRNERFVRRYWARAEAIGALEPEMRALTDAQLRERFGQIRERIRGGASPEECMVEAFAVAREVMDRAVGIRNIFDPKQNFDPSRLPERVRGLYDEVKAEMDALPPIVPITAVDAPADLPRDERNEFRGCDKPVPGWLQVDIPVEIYEAVRELYPESKPPFRARPFDVQLIGAMVLYNGKIAEMKTGEGKTIVAPLAAALAAADGLKVHVVTVNDYLVQRDRDWTFPFFHAMGLTVGAIHPMHMQPEPIKREMYRCDVVYGTTSEFGFDYLRDNMKRSVDQQVQRRRDYAIVDEVDSILIDEARTPLLISGLAFEDQPRYELADKLARHLVSKQKPWQDWDDRVQACKKRIKGLEGDIRNARDKAKIPELRRQLDEAKAELPGLESKRDEHTQYYEIKEERKQVHLTHEGIAEAQRHAGVGSFYIDENMDIPHLLENALRAHVVYLRDRDYIIMDTEDPQTGRMQPSVVIVDTFTGRPMIGRQWSDGLHQAIECKERVPIKQETQTIATITIQNFFKMYKRLAGMTGTADTEAQEFHDIYHLDVVSIPTNKPMIRRDFDDRMYLTARDKWDAIVDEIKAFHDVGRPILVGTTSVEKSEMLSQMLAKKHQIRHEVLNAKQHEREAHIIENAGQLGAVMIATNMAGRGTDIKLGSFTRQQLLDHWLRRGLAPRTLRTDDDEATLREKVYRKVAPQHLDIPRHEAEKMPFEELELRLLRRWATLHTWMSERRIASADAAALREELDKHGRFLLHNIRWFQDVEDMGGLHVVGTERHESRRIDNQLRGRSGRQGDKGSSRFFVSLEDDLMRMFAGERTMKILARLGMKEGDAIDNPMLSRSIERAQKKVEERNFQIRKNLLDMDEVMEFQRQEFYGLRQRVLEGRDVKGLILEYIEDAVLDACEEYLDKDYPARCAAEFAQGRLECFIEPERLRGRHRDEIEQFIRKEAIDEARHSISITLGEFMPMEGSEVSVDFDSAGLINWARSRFGVELNAADLREGGAEERRRVLDLLTDAAIRRIEEADLTGVDEFFAPDYGARKLVQWAKEKFGIEVSVDEIRAAQKDEERSPAEPILEKARELYRNKEIHYPVQFMMALTQQKMRMDPKAALADLSAWARRRFGLDLPPDEIVKTPPQKVHQRLVDAQREFVESGRLAREVEEALACPDDDALAAHIRERFGVEDPIPEWMRGLKGQDRRQAIQGRIEQILRSEMLYLEQVIALETLDSAWRDHLYAIDQLRDSIGFRSFAQQDYRIEFKREASKLMKEMMKSVRDRITDMVIRAELMPRLPAGSQPQRRVPAGAGPGLSPLGGRITGPGLDL